MIPFEQWTQEQRETYWAGLLERMNSPAAFNANSNITITKVCLDYCEGELNITPACGNTLGAVHGGCLATLADTVGGCAAASRGSSVVTLNCNYSYLRSATGKKIYCSASPLKVGHKIAVFYVTLTNDNKVVIGDGSFTYYVRSQLNVEQFPGDVLDDADLPAES